MHTVEAFHTYDPSLIIIIVLPQAQQACWRELCRQHRFETPHQVADGGESRFHSVRNGLQQVTGEGVVAVHDGVRPFVSQTVIADCYRTAEEKRTAIPVLEVTDTIRKTTGDRSVTVDRAAYKLVQTPQVFDIALLKQAYRQDYSPLFTDDASVVEALGARITLVPGNRENIKITTPLDLKIATVLI
jgi:2-C-methyl-D-erythritol 4-phosphate cytidylyltransferase